MNNTPTPPAVNLETCTGCGLCVKACPVFTLELRNEKASVARGEWCLECGHCGAVCPVEAIIQKRTAVTGVPKPGKTPAVTPETLELLLRERRSVRSYRREPIAREVLERIINAGRYAPTGTNSQLVDYMVLTTPKQIADLRDVVLKFNVDFMHRLKNPLFAMFIRSVIGAKTLAKLKEYSPLILEANEAIARGEDPMLHHAQAVMLVHAPTWDGSPAFNCAAALYHCSLMAHALGVGVCFNGWVENTINNNRKLKKQLGIPKDHKCYGAMTMGYQDIRYMRLIERDQPNVRWL